MYVVDPSSYAHVTQLGRGGKREGGREVNRAGSFETARETVGLWIKQRERED